MDGVGIGGFNLIFLIGRNSTTTNQIMESDAIYQLSDRVTLQILFLVMLKNRMILETKSEVHAEGAHPKSSPG